jgi:putative ABC transport system ATP-binding protein
LAREGRTIIVATHDERLLPLADQVIELSPRRRDAGDTRTVSLADSETLFVQGDDGDFIYVVEHGTVELTRERDDGSEELITAVGPERYFGELAPLFGLKRSATARALGATTVTGYSPSAFRSLVGHATFNELIGDDVTTS